MILGVGTDLLDIRRIERTLERFAGRFLERVYTPQEQARCEGHINRCARYAQRYAAKEACAKALGTGFRQGVAWRDIEVVSLPSGKPMIRVQAGALDRLIAMTPPGMVAKLDVSLTDEYPWAQAIVLIWAESAPPRSPSIP